MSSAVPNKLHMFRGASLPWVLIWMFSLTLSVNAQASKSSKPTATPCPTVTLNFPEKVDEGQVITFTVTTARTAPDQQLFFEWKLVPEVPITTGTGTSTLVVETENYGGDNITATVTVTGIADCPPITKTGSVYVRRLRAENLGKYTEKTLELRPVLRDIARKRLQTEEEGTLVIVAHDRRTIARLNHARMYRAGLSFDGEAMALAQQDKASLMAAGVNANRIQILRGAPEDQVTVEFYFVPKNALGPLPNQPAGAPQFAQVDVMWALQTPKVVQENFGGHIKRTYYCVEIVIFNRSGYEFQVAGLGFTVPRLSQSALGQNAIPPTNYSLVRRSVNEGQRTGLRNRSVALIRQLGLVLTGVTPFFHAVNRQANFSKLTNLLNSPVAVALEMMFPDRTIEYLEHLDDAAFRQSDNMRLSIANNRSVRTFVFVPKDLLNLDKTRRDDPREVMLALGRVFVFGDTVQSLKSVKVYSDPQLISSP